MLHKLLPGLFLCVAATLTSGCVTGGDEDGEDEAAGDLSEPDAMCLSGTAWIGGDTESSRMHPGADCLACHADRGEAQEVKLAGTVFGAANELDDCFGVPGVVLELTDANGDVTAVTSNAAGNFVLTEAIATPYTALLEYEGRERAMVAMQTEMSCNSCHTETGANGAPGRILAP